MPRRERRAWTIILVPPRPGATTRRVRITARSVGTLGTICLAIIGLAATSTTETSSFATTTAARLAESQRTVVALLDSVQGLRELVERERASRLPPRNMIMPVGGTILSRFSSSRLHPILEVFRAHRGVDVAAPLGTDIVAPAAGRVRFVGRRIGYGLTVELEHSGNVVTRYAHCRTAVVKIGQTVNVGQTIATVGTSGLSTGPHVHFEVINRGRSVDPIRFLADSRLPPHSAAPRTAEPAAGLE